VPVKGYGGYLDMACDMLRSLRKHSSAEKLFCCWDGLNSGVLEAVEDAWQGPLVANDLKDFGFEPGRHYSDYRMWAFDRLSLEDGAEVLRLECDLLFCGDPFDCFEYDFDVGFVQRAFWHGQRATNMGLVACRWSPITRAFLHDWRDEIRNPRLPSFVQIDNLSAKDGWGWTREEMYPWAVLRHTMGNFCPALLPSEFNWFPREARKEGEANMPDAFRQKWASPGACRAFHFKGIDKSVMAELARGLS